MSSLGSSRRYAAGAAAALAVFAMSAAPANAQQSAEPCPATPTSKPFLPFLDAADYVLAPDGDMESGVSGWELRGGAAIAEGNELFYVGGTSDRASLRLAPASSATSAPMCIGVEHPTLRFFARRDGGSLFSSLLVEALFTDAAGVDRSLPIAAVTNWGIWSPTAPIVLGVNVLGLTDTKQVSFRFTARGSGWSIDDVYVDPYRMR